MPLNLEGIHVYAKVPGTQQVRLVSTNPAIRLCAEQQPPVWIQGGIAYYEGGDRVPLPAPLWLLEAIQRLTKDIRAEVGLTDAALKLLGGK